MENYNLIPSICIIGRPNVGKSSLFNCLLQERRAVVVAEAGTTRDRLETIIFLDRTNFRLVDTGGYVSKDKDALSLDVKTQIYLAMNDASLILMVTDAQSGITPFDREIALVLRKSGKGIILVANKVDNDRLISSALEFYELGFGKPEEVSCLHKTGIVKLKKRIKTALKGVKGREKQQKEIKRLIRIAVVGRPNVGKSSFINKVLSQDRLITSDLPGTTRDSIDICFEYKGEEYVLIDTAGIRHKRKIKNAADVYSIMRSKESIKRADIVFLLLDAKDGLTRDDMKILDFIEEKGKACLILINKWDLSEKVKDVSEEGYKKHLLYVSNRLSKFPILFVSSKTGKNILQSFSEAKVLDANLDFKAGTPFLNGILKKKDPSLIPVSRNKKRPNFFYMVQTSCRPIEFKIFVNNPANVLSVHKSFIERQLRLNLPLSGLPIKLLIRQSEKKRKV